MAGESKREVVVVDYDPSWALDYEVERDAILQRAGDVIVAIEHVGSTSVPGLAAKPVIDIMAAVHTLEEYARVADAVAPLGYVVIETGMQRRLFLRKYDTPPVPAHLHLVEWSTWHDRNERLLRDYLRLHPDDAAAYGALKQELSAAYTRDPEGYTKAKTAFIQTIVDRARDAAGLSRVDVWET